MVILRIGILFLFLSFTVSMKPGQKIEEGIVEYTITYPGISKNSKDELDALPQKMRVLFKSNRFRLELFTIVGTTVIISDGNKHESYMLAEMMGKKIALLSTAEDIRKLEEYNQDRNPVSIQPGTKPRKIAGIKCRQLMVKAQTENGLHEYDAYYTDELPDFNSTLNNKLYANAHGFMLHYEAFTNGMIMRFTANKIVKTPLSDSLFLVPEDYVISRQQY